MTKKIHKVQYYETDRMQVTHHSNYIRFFEEARVECFEEIGLGYDMLEKMGIICPVLTVDAQYRGMTDFCDELEVTCIIKKFNGIRLEFAYEIRDCATGVLKTTGSSTHTFVDRDHKLISIKKQYPDVYKKLLSYVEG